MSDEAKGRPDGGLDEDNQDIKVVDRRWWARSQTGTETDTGSDPGGSSKPSYVQDLEKQLADKDALLKDYASKYKAAAGDFDATRERLRRDLAKDVQREKRRVLASFLDVIDNLDRAIEAIGAADGAATLDRLGQGVEMVRQQFLSVLASHGVAPFDARGEPFDPTRHDAVSIVPVTSPDQEDQVVEVIATGYCVDDDILRPARVTVGKRDSEPR